MTNWLVIFFPLSYTLVSRPWITAPAHPHATWVAVYPALFSYYCYFSKLVITWTSLALCWPKAVTWLCLTLVATRPFSAASLPNHHLWEDSNNFSKTERIKVEMCATRFLWNSGVYYDCIPYALWIYEYRIDESLFNYCTWMVSW